MKFLKKYFLESKIVLALNNECENRDHTNRIKSNYSEKNFN